MKTAIIEIGNSKGLRLPKAILEQCQINDSVELTIDGKTIIIKPAKSNPRHDWQNIFTKAGREKSAVMSDDIDLISKDWV